MAYFSRLQPTLFYSLSISWLQDKQTLSVLAFLFIPTFPNNTTVKNYYTVLQYVLWTGENRDGTSESSAMDLTVFPRFVCWSPHPRCDGIWRRAFRGIRAMRSWGWGSHDGVSALVRRDIRVLLLLWPLPPPGKATRAHGERVIRTWPYWHPDLRLPACGTMRHKSGLIKAACLWYFIMAPWAKTGLEL